MSPCIYLVHQRATLENVTCLSVALFACSHGIHLNKKKRGGGGLAQMYSFKMKAKNSFLMSIENVPFL